MAVVYALFRKDTNEVFYVGQTKNVKVRFIQHKASIRKLYKPPVALYIKELINNNINIDYFIIDAVDDSELNFWELHYISLFKGWFPNLKNGFIKGNNYAKGTTHKRKAIYTTINGVRYDFESITIASEQLNIGRRSINNNLTGLSHLSHGLKFNYA
jgi:hypothetical protein